MRINHRLAMFDKETYTMAAESDTWALHRVLRDNQGSILAVTDANGLVQQRMDYDAWGALRAFVYKKAANIYLICV